MGTTKQMWHYNGVTHLGLVKYHAHIISNASKSEYERRRLKKLCYGGDEKMSNQWSGLLVHSHRVIDTAPKPQSMRASERWDGTRRDKTPGGRSLFTSMGSSETSLSGDKDDPILWMFCSNPSPKSWTHRKGKLNSEIVLNYHNLFWELIPCPQSKYTS
ncbi:hypothetical protein VNO77_27923 [Canavalia gladiata]|uniref:Uncharacterized protein n=1 Tax=Canavalia gladiata TaxID=3824 RepID=A0AAN9KY70_CANGL